jgi:serine/threonine-protein kinase HipA
MTRELTAVFDRHEMGRFVRDARGHVTFTYTNAWRERDDAFPLSLSMPLTQREHGHTKTDPFLWGLLPDNEAILSRWGRRFHVSARNSFGLVAAVGEDCAGAVQFVRPDRLNTILGHAPSPVEWLDEAGVAQRLRALREDNAAWRAPRDTGQFSLAGAQPKTALLLQDGRWGVPSGRTPTTHIFKPPSPEYDGHAENEHFCLELARAVGLPVANSRIMRFQDEIAIVIERYDRARTPNGIRRVHQEDTCQALSIQPTRKYENDGGPGVRTVVDLLRDNSSNPPEDTNTFIDSVAYNWLIAGPDAHGKNYALLIGAEGRVRLAPLFDIASVLPYYRDFDMRRVRMAMRIGREYRLQKIGLRQWQRQAQELRLDAATLISRINEMGSSLSEHAPLIAQQVKGEGIRHPVIDQLSRAIVTRIAQCRGALR